MKVFGNHLSVLKISGKCNEICNKKHFFGELPFDAIHYQSCYSNSQLKTFAFCLCSPCSHFFFVVDIKVSANARFLQSLCTIQLGQEDLPKLRSHRAVCACLEGQSGSPCDWCNELYVTTTSAKFHIPKCPGLSHNVTCAKF